jgi:hypothetical protein
MRAEVAAEFDRGPVSSADILHVQHLFLYSWQRDHRMHFLGTNFRISESFGVVRRLLAIGVIVLYVYLGAGREVGDFAT